MSLLLTRSDVPSQRIGADAQAFEASMVYGPEASVIYSTKPPGYHARPHFHNCEQMTYVVSGELWAFVIDERGRTYSFHMEAGDFKRVPKMAIHWSWNRSNAPCSVIDMHMPGLQTDPLLAPTAKDLFAPWESPKPSGDVRIYAADAGRYATQETEQLPASDEGPHGLFRRSSDVPLRAAAGGSLMSRMVYGHAGSIMVATRHERYHSKPHVHDCDQLNLVITGDLWGYVVDPYGNGHAFHLHPGDFWRVPRMAVHWALQETGEACSMAEFHCPGLQSASVVRGLAMPLFADYEDARTTGSPSNLFLDPAMYPVRETEASGDKVRQ